MLIVGSVHECSPTILGLGVQVGLEFRNTSNDLVLSHSRPVGPARCEGRGVGPNWWLGSHDETLTKVF